MPGSAPVAAVMLPLLLWISPDIYVVTRLSLADDERWIGVSLASAAFAVVVALWIAFPYSRLLRTPRCAGLRELTRS